MIAGVLAVLVMLLSLASVSPALHNMLHDHAEHSDTTPAHAEHTHHLKDAHEHGKHPCKPSNGSKDTGSQDCDVTLLDPDVDFTALIQLPQQSELQFVYVTARYEKVWKQLIRSSQSARGPPTIIVV